MPLRRPGLYKKFDICQLNAQSVNNKTHSICDFISRNDLDLLATSETWLGRDTDKVVISELLPPNYNILHVPRQIGTSGGGVGMVYKNNI